MERIVLAYSDGFGIPAVDAFVDVAQARVTGSVRLRQYTGTYSFVGRSARRMSAPTIIPPVTKS